MTNHCGKDKLAKYTLCLRFGYILKTMFDEISLQRTQMYESICKWFGGLKLMKVDMVNMDYLLL